MEIRLARPEEYEELGALTVAAYAAIEPGGPRHLGDYEDELRDVAGRAAGADVLIAIDADNQVLGGVTYVPGPDSPSAEFADADSAGIRMLAVGARAQGQGVGEALVRACVERARAAGKERLVLHTTDWMTAAHRLYGRLGFERDPSLDWEADREFWLRGFVLASLSPR